MKVPLPQTMYPLIDKAGGASAGVNGALYAEDADADADADADGIVDRTQAMSLRDEQHEHVNGGSRDRKGKGKAVHVPAATENGYPDGFGDAGGVGGDDGLYD